MKPVIRSLGGVVFALVILAIVLQSYVLTGGSLGLALGRVLASAALKPPKEQGLISSAAELARNQPLNPHAFLVIAWEQQPRGDAASTERLVRQAETLDPRLGSAKVWLAKRYLESGRVQEGVDELAVLFRLEPEDAAPMVPILASASRDPAVRRALARSFANTTVLVDVAARAAAVGVLPKEIIEMVHDTDFTRLPGGISAAQSAIMGGYRNAQDYQHAYEIWQAFSPGSSEKGLHDGSFSGRIAAPPFTWSLKSSADIETAVVPSGLTWPSTALRVEVYGSLPSLAAEQYLLLKPGQYGLGYMARVDDAVQPVPEAYWSLQCISRTQIGENKIERLSGTWTRRYWQFAIPEDCSTQILRLSVTNKQDSENAALLVTNLTIATVSER